MSKKIGSTHTITGDLDGDGIADIGPYAPGASSDSDSSSTSSSSSESESEDTQEAPSEPEPEAPAKPNSVSLRIFLATQLKEDQRAGFELYARKEGFGKMPMADWKSAFSAFNSREVK